MLRDWKIRKYRISGGIETIIVTDYRSTEKSAKSPIYRWSTNKSAKNREWRHAWRSRRRSLKNRRLIDDFTDILAIFWNNRQFFYSFDLTAKFEFLRIWWPRFHPCICKGLQRLDLWSNGGKSIFTLSKGYGVFPTVIWRSNGEIWTKFWANG